MRLSHLACLIVALFVAACLPVRAAEGFRASTYVVQDGETLHDIALKHNLGFLELRAANPDVEPWLPGTGTRLVLPTVHLPPERMDKGILINLAQMRLWYWPGDGSVETYPIGIGRGGLETPNGVTRVVRKKADPAWYPPPAMRKRKPELPKMVPPGPANPLGRHALYLGWPAYLIHGTNNPYGIGRRVSSGCIRMYPDDVAALFERVPNGTPVKVVDMRASASWQDGRLWLEVQPSAEAWDALEQRAPLPVDGPPPELARVLAAAAPEDVQIDWEAVDHAVAERSGVPVAVSTPRGLLMQGF